LAAKNARMGEPTDLGEQPICLSYVSRRASPGDDGEVERIVAAASSRNASEQLSGALLAFEDHFVQAIEGPRDKVLAAFERIRRDPRHSDVKLLAEEPITRRRFAEPLCRVEVGGGCAAPVRRFIAAQSEGSGGAALHASVALLEQLALLQSVKSSG
jgi:Sensors of blue-light using FAD